MCIIDEIRDNNYNMTMNHILGVNVGFTILGLNFKTWRIAAPYIACNTFLWRQLSIFVDHSLI